MISVSGLKKSYSGNIAVEDLSFEVEEGQVYGLLGPKWRREIYNYEYFNGLYFGDRRLRKN